MKITLQELELIASTPSKECFVCSEIIQNIFRDTDGDMNISGKTLINNPDMREHLRQIIKR